MKYTLGSYELNKQLADEGNKFYKELSKQQHLPQMS